MEIWKLIEEKCKAENITFYELSKRSGVSESIISRIRSGHNKKPTFATIIKLCEGAGIKQIQI